MKYFLALLMLSCFLFTAVEGLSPPKPIVGTPSFITPKFSATSGSFTYKIDIPLNWGLGNTSTSPDGKASFALFPLRGGHGCSIEVQPFKTEDHAANALNKIRKKFKNTKNLGDGFEVELSRAWFSCRVTGHSLIKTWYSLSKKSSRHASQWRKLKKCTNVLKANDQIPEITDPKLVTKFVDGWQFDNPTKDKYLYFKTRDNGELRFYDNFIYRLSFEDSETNAKGFFYIAWNQTQLNTPDPYQNLAEQIAQQMKEIDYTQIFDPIKLYPEKGYAILPGDPCGIVLFGQDDFISGFAVKRITTSRDMDINKLISKVNLYLTQSPKS